ncbi:hypothetical protein L1887_17032 [Cichorium endivia]|nr:hypothetical protein L1887_17032 [Cichorium endivia]
MDSILSLLRIPINSHPNNPERTIKPRYSRPFIRHLGINPSLRTRTDSHTLHEPIYTQKSPQNRRIPWCLCA